MAGTPVCPAVVGVLFARTTAKIFEVFNSHTF